MLLKISKQNNIKILNILNTFKKVLDENILKENGKYDNKLENIHKFINSKK